jgi:hypothetical protein
MKRRIAALIGALPLALALAAAPMGAQVQQSGSPIDDLLKRAQDAFNDLNYARADSLARQVLQIGSVISASQRTGALLVIAAAAFPEEVSAQRRAVALTTLKELVRTNMSLRMPQEITWSGLDSLMEEARRTTFAMEVSADSVQRGVGPGGMATLRVRGSRPGRYQLVIMPAAGGPAVVVDSSRSMMAGEFRFATMRNQRPVFATGDSAVIVTGIDSASRDTITARYTATVQSPTLDFLTVPTRLDSARLLPERTRKFGARSIFPAILVGGAAFALSSTLRGEGGIATSVAADSKGAAVGGALALTTMLAGFADRGRAIPANIAANKAYGEAFQKSIVDTQAENQRRINEHTTTIRFDLVVR